MNVSNWCARRPFGRRYRKLISSKSGRVESGRYAGRQTYRRDHAPADRFRFSTNLRSASQGRAGLTMQFREFDLAN